MVAQVVKFEYGAFRDHYRTLGSVVEGVVVRFYKADYHAMKIDKQGRSVPFLHRSAIARTLPDDDPLRRMHPFLDGAYVVYPTTAADDSRKQLFIVYPTRHELPRGAGTMFVADHFSFVLNPGRAGVGKVLNFHRTEYQPDRLAPNDGTATRVYNPLQTSFNLPTSPDAFFRTGLFTVNPLARREYADVLVTMLAHPFLSLSTGTGASAAAAAATPATSSATGGGGTGRRRSAAAARLRKAAGRSSRRFDDLWRELPIHSIAVFCIPGENADSDATVSVFVTDRFKYSSAARQAAAAFTMHPDSISDDSAVEERVASALSSSLSWDTMRLQHGNLNA